MGIDEGRQNQARPSQGAFQASPEKSNCGIEHQRYQLKKLRTVN
jgi:hypothetical protein